MSMLARPSVVFAIVFGCFAVLIPRVFVPLFRPRQSAPVHQQYERKRFPINKSKYHHSLPTDFRQPSSPPTTSIPRNDNDDHREHAPVCTRYRSQKKNILKIYFILGFFCTCTHASSPCRTPARINNGSS